MGARVNQLLGQLDPRRVGGGVDRGLAELRLDPALERGGDPASDLLAKLVQRLELGRLRGKLVVELGQVLLPDLLHGDREARLLARQALGLVVVVEPHLHRALVARCRAGEGLVELGQQAIRAELDHQVGGVRALERLAVDGPRVVDYDQVAGGGGAVHGVKAREPLAQPIQLGLNRVSGNLGLRPTHLQPLVLAELRGGPHRHLDREGELLAGVAEARRRSTAGRQPG